MYGFILVADFLERVEGKVVGQIRTDAKVRTFGQNYAMERLADGRVRIARSDGHGDTIVLPGRIALTRELIAFFGLYSGDGAKGSEDPEDRTRIKAAISFSQREPNLVRFAVDRFRSLFGDQIRFTFSLGEDSAFFMAGEGAKELAKFYGGMIPARRKLADVRPSVNDGDRQYLQEVRDVPGTTEEHLAFYYQYKDAMKQILTAVKIRALEEARVVLRGADSVTASLRRPFKKGARAMGGSSRADEIHVGGLNGLGELFLKILYELEESLYDDSQLSPQGLIEWTGAPSQLGEDVDLRRFFGEHAYGQIAGERPRLDHAGGRLSGRWPRSREFSLAPRVRLDPLFIYASGLYLAEGGTPKNEMFAMYRRRPDGFAIGFTSSEETSITLMLRYLGRLLEKDDVLASWKIKVGSQYFPELVAIGLKFGAPMLRGGASGDGKLRTVEISRALKPWALEVCPSLEPFAARFSHVEPTGAGVARIDFATSSAAAKWLFPLLIYAVFGGLVHDPAGGFVVE